MNIAIKFVEGCIPPMSAFDATTLYYVLLAALGLAMLLFGRRKWAERVETESLLRAREARKKMF